MERILRISARASGTVLLVFLLFMLIGHLFGDANPEGMRFTGARDVVAFIFFPVGTIIGLALAYKWEFLGGASAVVSLLALFLLMPGTIMGRFLVMLLPGLLYLLSALLARGRKGVRTSS